ncbi:borealin-2-like isoform X2 [Rhineura floridana]|uniref:borealin-2-like isoform X2 n=1 Tax=Rhineura floridana TaxID=261503 RepID=UPI002AC8881D|nr:borealin-2-like isoform X2 [Rhineura floridana]
MNFSGSTLRRASIESKENLHDLKKELASLLQTAEQAFRVESLTMPVVMRKMRRKDLLDLKEAEAAAATVVATAEANECCVGDMPTPRLVRTNSKRVKVTTIVEYKEEKEGGRTPAKKTSQKAFKTNSLASLASAIKGKQGSLSRSACFTPNGRAIERSASMRERPVSVSKCISLGSKRFPQKGLCKSASASERSQAMTLRSTSMPHERSVPFVNIPLADGQTLCSAGDDLQNINVELLNEDTVQHIHTLVSQLSVLCGKATVK